MPTPIETITKKIETAAIDIAPTYPDWRDLAFALSNELGEAGRSYYHRLSQFHPNYTKKETDKQYTACLKSKGAGITIKTLFHLAKQAGVKLVVPSLKSSKSLLSSSPARTSTSLPDVRHCGLDPQPPNKKIPNPQNENIENLRISNNTKFSNSQNITPQKMITPAPELPSPPTVPKVPNTQMEKSSVHRHCGLDPQPPHIETEKPPRTPHQDTPQSLLPTFPPNIYNQLPNFLKKITAHANSNEDADLLLLGSLVVTSACFPNVYGIYGGVTVFPNLFLFVSAPASAGKGRLALCRRLVEPIHKQMRELNKLEVEEYNRQKIEYRATVGAGSTRPQGSTNPEEQPLEPPLRVLFVPANSSATAVFQILSDNNGVGLIFETEGDTLAQTFKSEHGNYSDGFRKAFHHEKISYLRRKDREYITLEIPKLSALLSGTPKQVKTLIPDAENGLFSRFMFYYMNIRLQWIDVFANNDNISLDQQFNQLGQQFFDFYIKIKPYKNIKFTLTKDQQTTFNTHFEQIQLHYWEQLGNDYIGTIRRLGLITFRIAMILTTLRIMETDAPPRTTHPDTTHQLTCTTPDFHTAMQISKTLLHHATHIFHQLQTLSPVIERSRNDHNQTDNLKTTLFKALPEQFNHKIFIQTATSLKIPESTVDRNLAKFLNSNILSKISHGYYKKTNNE